MLILTRKEVEKLIPPKEIKKVIDVVEKAFFDYGRGEVQMPSKLYLNFKKFNGDLRIMPSFSETLEMTGTKLVNVHPGNSHLHRAFGGQEKIRLEIKRYLIPNLKHKDESLVDGVISVLFDILHSHGVAVAVETREVYAGTDFCTLVTYEPLIK